MAAIALFVLPHSQTARMVSAWMASTLGVPEDMIRWMASMALRPRAAEAEDRRRLERGERGLGSNGCGARDMTVCTASRNGDSGSSVGSTSTR